MALVKAHSEASAARLHLVTSAQDPLPVPRHSPASLWHLLSLDAPTVAAVWTGFAAWCAGVRISWVDAVAIFVGVWMLYATDRLLDARPLAEGVCPPDLEERHYFHNRHRHRFFPALVAVTLPFAYLLHRLAPPVLHLYSLLAALLGGWLLLVHAETSPKSSRRLPKELAVGLFFPAAIFIPTVARAPGLRLFLLPDALLFAGICSLNCLFLYAWEHPDDHSRAHATTRYALNRLLGLTCFLLATSLAVAVAMSALPRTGLMHASRLPHPSAVPIACAFTAALFLLLHIVRDQLPPLRLRALADLVLLTPLLPFLFALLGPQR